MNSNRPVISDAVRERVAPHLPGKVSDRGVTARSNRLFVETDVLLFQALNGADMVFLSSRWADLPGRKYSH